jgi:4-diphosphocytidyl-2-C-methyl-D-erythritol kinase
MLTIFAPAKINWYLEILGKRPDGFHEIETVMQAISLFDEIQVAEVPKLQLDCSIDLGPPESNLAWRAAALLRDEHAPGRGARIRLEKRIPHGAGLGGGSSDAACTLVALNRLWDLRLSAERLRELAGRIGSDCAFFVEGGTALCTGRGEIVQALPDMAGMHVVILYPGEVCPTGPVYAEATGPDDRRGLTPERQTCYFTQDRIEVLDQRSLAAMIFNRLQDAALRVSRALNAAWGETGQEKGALARFVSGSGSSIAFLMESSAAASALAESLVQRGLGQSFATTTLPRGVNWGHADA